MRSTPTCQPSLDPTELTRPSFLPPYQTTGHGPHDMGRGDGAGQIPGARLCGQDQGAARFGDRRGCVIGPTLPFFSPRHLIDVLTLTPLTGTGLVGLACAALGAKEALLTDLLYTLENLQANAARNEVIMM